jgi:N-acetylglucosaminyl-diphospho-decaprenol L-rhamnosyltransferase
VARVAPEVREAVQEGVSGPAGPDISIVIVGYQSRDDLEGCLGSIAADGTRAAIEAIVVDNCSSDETAAMIRERFPWVRLFENTANLGYSRAVNQGVRASRGRYALVLNPDIRVLPGALDALLAFMEGHGDAAIAGAKLLSEDGAVQDSCRRFHTLWSLVLRRTFLGRMLPHSRSIERYLMLDFDHESSIPVDWVFGACMMVRKRSLDDIGLMDERFFLYFEDVDWCYRAWRAGWKVYYVADAVMRHKYARESARPGISRLLLVHVVSLFHFYEKWGRIMYRMKRYRDVVRRTALLISDLVAVNGAFALSYALRSSLRGLLTKPMFGVGVYAPFLVFANIVLIFSFGLFGLYAARTEREDGPATLLRVFRATLVAAVILMASTFLTSQTLYSRLLVGTFSVLTIALVTLLRMGLKAVHRIVREGRFDLVRVAIVGRGPEASGVAGRMLGNPELGYDLAGFVDSGDSGPAVPVIGTLDDLPRLIEEQRIGEVVFADPGLSGDRLADFLLRARRSAVDVKMLSGLSDILTQRARVEEFLDRPAVVFEREALQRVGAGVKRGFDLIVGALLLALGSPAFALTALVTARRGGPVVAEERVGLEGRSFRMLGLAPNGTASAVRRFVTRHGFDGYPSLVNVLRGEMSLVGPAPLVADQARSLDARALLRFDARPGVTGLARVARGRDGGGADAGALDAYYVQNWSLWGDVGIALRWIGRCAAGRCAPNTGGAPGGCAAA